MFKNSPAFSGYSVNDLVSAQKFYSGVLGCNVSSSEMGLNLVFPNGQTLFIYEKADHKPATFTVLNFPVDHIDETIDELTAKGVVMERYNTLPASQDEKGVLRGKTVNMGPDIAWFKDSAGNVLSVLEGAI
jgi:predicted enzyme related to lactoylglutathione lyase